MCNGLVVHPGTIIPEVKNQIGVFNVGGNINIPMISIGIAMGQGVCDEVGDNLGECSGIAVKFYVAGTVDTSLDQCLFQDRPEAEEDFFEIGTKVEPSLHFT